MEKDTRTHLSGMYRDLEMDAHMDKQIKAPERKGSSKEATSGDAAVGAAITKAGTSAAHAAAGASRSLVGGLSAIRDVRHAKKQRADAQADLRDIERLLEADRSDLAHRREIERNYPQIVSAQKKEIAKAKAEASEADAHIKECEKQIRTLKEELGEMKERHEQELRPYRNLMEGSRGRSDDAAKALATIRRSVRNAEGALNDATKRREQRIAAANRAVDNARERLTVVQNEQSVLQEEDAQSSSAALAKVQSEIATEETHLQTAREEVVQVTKESQGAVDQAQQTLWGLKRELAAAEKTAADAKQEATARKEEYDNLYKQAQAEEKAHEESIKSCESRIRDYKKTRDAARKRMEDAHKILHEANEIHAHPETTEGLRQRIADEEEDLATAQEELADLTESERELRRSTRGSRAAVIAILITVLIIVILIAWTLVPKG